MRYFVTLVTVVLAVTVLTSGEAPAQRVGSSAKDTLIYRKLDDTIVSFTFNEQPLEEAVDFLQTLGGVNIVLDRRQVDEGPVVSLKLNNVPLTTAMNLMTEQVDLKWAVMDGVVIISDEEGVRQEPVTVVYPVDDLLAIPPDFEGPTMELQDLNTQTTGTGGSSGYGSTGGLWGDDEETDDSEEFQRTREELLEDLVELIKAVIEPGTWDTDY